MQSSKRRWFRILKIRDWLLADRSKLSSPRDVEELDSLRMLVLISPLLKEDSIINREELAPTSNRWSIRKLPSRTRNSSYNSNHNLFSLNYNTPASRFATLTKRQ